MSKLTAERAQERIAHLKQWQEQRGLTLREEEYLEAMEIAAHVLECTKNRIACYFSPISLARHIKSMDVRGFSVSELSRHIVAFVEGDK